MVIEQHNIKAAKDESFQNSNHRSSILQLFEKEVHITEITHKIFFYAIKIVNDPHLSPELNLNSSQWSKFTYFLPFPQSNTYSKKTV